jgi:hypothetical protein
MKHARLIAAAGAAIIASASPLLVGVPAASAAVVASGTTTLSNGCSFSWTLAEDRDSGGAYVDVHLVSDACNIGVEAVIEGPSGSPVSTGGDIHNARQDSVTGDIPVNSGNFHGFRDWYDNQWLPVWTGPVP